MVCAKNEPEFERTRTETHSRTISVGDQVVTVESESDSGVVVKSKWRGGLSQAERNAFDEEWGLEWVPFSQQTVGWI